MAFPGCKFRYGLEFSLNHISRDSHVEVSISVNASRMLPVLPVLPDAVTGDIRMRIALCFQTRYRNVNQLSYSLNCFNQDEIISMSFSASSSSNESSFSRYATRSA